MGFVGLDEENDYTTMADSFGDQVENAQDKRSEGFGVESVKGTLFRIAIRQKAIDNILLVLHKSFIPESVEKWRGTLVEIIEKNLKRTAEETVRVCSLAALIALELGNFAGE